MCIALGQGQTTPRGHNFDVNRKILSLRSFVTSLKTNLFEILFYIHFLISLYMYVAPGQRQTIPWGQNFDVNKKAVSICPFVANLKQIPMNSDFIHFFFFMLLYMHIAWGRSRQPLGDKILMSTETSCHFGHLM